jgi:hypothetical protein
MTVSIQPFVSTKHSLMLHLRSQSVADLFHGNNRGIWHPLSHSAPGLSCIEYKPALHPLRALSLASSYLPLLTEFHGDSGANQQPMIRGIGQIHCRTKGSFQARLPSIPATARTTPDERRIPAPQHIQTYAVTYGRRTVGTTSQAYVVESV